MTFSEALEEMKKGQEITRPKHKDYFYFKIMPFGENNNKLTIVTHYLSGHIYMCGFHSDDILANDWELAP